MLFIRKLILLSALGGGITIPTVKAVNYVEPDEKLLEYDAITKKWDRLLKKIPQSELSQKLSALFSANLTTFAKAAMENTAKQLLVNWIIEIWENPDYYFPISYRLNKFFSDYQLSYWKIKNNIDDLSWELIKNFFTDFFFKEKGWILLSKYGDFRSFVLKDWIDQEKPMMLYEWNIDYSSPSSSSKIYTENIMKTKSSNDPYLWPEFAYNEEYSTFISRFKNANKVDLTSFTKKIYTISDLKGLEDGYKLGTLLHLLTFVGVDWNTISQEEISTINLQQTNQTDEDKKDSYLENPMYLFLERKDQEKEENEKIDELAKPSDCSLIKNSIFNTEFSKRISNYDWKKPDYHFFSSNTHSCVYGLRKLENNLRQNEKLFASRETKGVSLYYLPHNKVDYSIDELTPDVSKKLEKYLKDNFEAIFFKYLNFKHSSKDTTSQESGAFNLKLMKTSSPSKKIGKWDFSTHYEKYKELLTASLEYRDSLYWMNNIYELQKILAKTYSKLPLKILLKEIPSNGSQSASSGSGGNSQNSTWKIQLETTEGLFSPLPFKRTTDEKAEEQEIKFSDLRNTTQTTASGQASNGKERKNDGFYSHLFDSLNSKKNLYSLEEKANNLKQKLSEKITTTDIKNLFLNDLFLRAQFEKIADEKEISEFSLFKLWAEKILFNGSGQQSNKNNSDFGQMISSYTSSVLKNNANSLQKPNNGTNDWNDLLEKTLFLEKYLNLPIEERSIFGNYQHDFKNEEKDNSKNITISNDDNNKKISMKAKNSWILKNYYLSDAAYESSSEEYRNFLSYLFAIYWMTKNNYENLPLLISHIFRKDPNKNAYLVWFKEIEEKNLSSLKNGKQPTQKDNEELPKLFETRISNDILNPLLMGKTTIDIKKSNGQSSTTASTSHSSLIKELQFEKENVLFKTQGYTKKAQAKNNNSNNVELAGFVGLFTSNFSTREIPKTIKETIFNSFWLKNSSSNINYSDNSSNSDSETIGGIFFEDNHDQEFKSNEDLKKFLLSFKSKWKLHKYLETDDSLRPHPKLLQALTQDKQNLENKEIEELTIQELRETIKKTLGNNIQQANSSPKGAKDQFTNLYKMWNRFSGYLYHGQDKQYPYVLDVEEGGKTKHYLAFLYQVNRFDFEKEKITKLKENISENTFRSMISLLASNKEVSEWIYKFGLANKLSLF